MFVFVGQRHVGCCVGEINIIIFHAVDSTYKVTAVFGD